MKIWCKIKIVCILMDSESSRALLGKALTIYLTLSLVSCLDSLRIFGTALSIALP